MLEKIVEKQIRQYLNNIDFFHTHQYGFRKNHETQHSLMAFQRFVIEAKKKKETVIAIFADLKKAFDTVNHNKLLNKISEIGIDQSWFKNYLTQRQQYVEIDPVLSSKKVTCGVPQGLHVDELPSLELSSFELLFLSYFFWATYSNELLFF